MYTKADWEKTTIIKDSVHGYINVPKPVSKEIIDTDIFQRLKNIEQTGMQVLYPSATHNRFMHSLGVYHLSKKAFRHFMINVRSDYPDIYKSVRTKYEYPGLIDGYEATWRRWELVFQLASLLHDCGHSPFSHTLEFIYDLVTEPSTLSQLLSAKFPGQFEKDFIKQSGLEKRDFVGKPHERMSALFVAQDDNPAEINGEQSQGGFRGKIRKLVESYLLSYGIANVYNSNNEIFDDDIEFMARMITGCQYDLECAGNYKAARFHKGGKEDTSEWEIELQLRNCIISMLNSKLDVDNLDYVVRDSKHSGYASNNIDLDRLLSSFTVINAYEFRKDSPLILGMGEKEGVFFDASVNLESFKGDIVNAKISGMCMISSKSKNLEVSGNILTDTDDYPKEGTQKKKILRTAKNFSANIFSAENLPDKEDICIKPKTAGQKAYLSISGKLRGNFVGTVLGDTYPGCKNPEGVIRRVFFAYKQNCMSVLMSAIDGSNFENKWVYAHHTTTFKNNFLIVYLLERYTEYLVDCDVNDLLKNLDNFIDKSEMTDAAESLSDINNQDNDNKLIGDFLQGCLPDRDEAYEAVRECLSAGLVPGSGRQLFRLLKLYKILKELDGRHTISQDKLHKTTGNLRGVLTRYKEKKFFTGADIDEINDIYNKYNRLGALEIQYFAEIMTMTRPVCIQDRCFFRTSDQDLLAAYKQLYYKLLGSSPDMREKYHEFMVSYRQLVTRTSMQCLWKTYPEYVFYFSDWTKKEKDKLKELLRRVSTPWIESKGEKQKNYSILSDYVHLSPKTEELWKILKNKYHLERLVYVEQDIRLKSFVPYETYMKNHERVVRLEDIRLYPDDKNNEEFFYIFFEYDDSKNKSVEEGNFTPGAFIKEVRDIIAGGKEEILKPGTEDKIMYKNGNIIRDNIHGDIVFPPLFKALVDTKEFQRLRRIKQLATAGQVFPGAVHTRFSHSIGTYYVMNKILGHFKEYFNKLNYNSRMDESDENAILAAALLHDLGHGPYSHTFEHIKISMGGMEHSEWTTSIIRDEHTEVHLVLESYEEGFAEKVAAFIQCGKEVKNGDKDGISKLDDKLNLEFIFASLVSGQIDADRMDYLLRDAKFSGVTYGQFDLEKIIEGLAVSVERTGRYRVCIKEEYLPVLEEYFFARFQMHKNIYFHPYKVFSEELFSRVLREAQNAVLSGELPLNDIPAAIESIFTQSEITNEEYCKLDDTVIDGATRTWAESDILKLSFLCKARLDRKFYRRIEVLDINRLKKDAEDLFGSDVWNRHFLIIQEKKFKLYDEENPVYILKKNGITDNFGDCSVLSKESLEETFVYYSRKMAEEVYNIDVKTLDIFDCRIEKNDVQSNMEIEKKYIFPCGKTSEVETRIQKFKENPDYDVKSYNVKLQEDIYFDTDNFQLKDAGYTLRIRKKGNEMFITCKRPIKSESNGIGGQLERIEYEESVHSGELSDNSDKITRFLKDLPGCDTIISDLDKRIEIKNNRKKIVLERKKGMDREFFEKYELAIDDVEYFNLSNKKTYKECQLEIELKSSCQNRINMIRLTDGLEAEMDFLETIGDSKYQRALKYTE